MATRGDSDLLLSRDPTKIRAVSVERVKALRKIGIETVRDLVEHYPRRYLDLSHVETAAQAPIGEFVTVVGTVHDVTEKTPRRNLHILEVTLFDGTGIIIATWFRQRWMAARFERGARVAFSGKVTFEYGFKRMNSPHVAYLSDAGSSNESLPPLLAIHGSTEGIPTNWMRRLVANALELTADVSDPLPLELRQRYGLMSRKRALRAMHFPETKEQMLAARRRLAYEEVLRLQLEMMSLRRFETQGSVPYEHEWGSFVTKLKQSLPFALTAEQSSAIDDILGDMSASKSMNRMLLGDVGTGKTVVAAFALAMSADSGYQAAMMAPTEVLARQYATKLGGLFDGIGLRWGVLTGSTSAQEREELLASVKDGSTQVLFGTHALIEPSVEFKELSLVVIDEQHRFGVDQRSALRMKSPGSDLLVMTATPIPRTLALTLYGDLETSYIRTRPTGAPPTTSEIVSRHGRGKVYEQIKAQLAQGRQAYIICPLVGVTREDRMAAEEADTLVSSLASGDDLADSKAAETEAASLQRGVFAGYRVGLLTGRMSPAEKDETMAAFNAGEIDVLVATTVVEVGIDVPNATVMMIKDAERFGLSQLHQLRGRVGRGEHPGFVYLIADPGKDDGDTKARLEAFVNTNDGFELAEADLRARHEGDVLGSRQHGAETLKLVNVIDDADLIACAHADAKELLDNDPELSKPEHQALAGELQALFSDLDQTKGKGA